jgi:hypothetical protein
MKKTLLLSAGLLCLFSFSTHAQVLIDWASTASPAASNAAVGSPDDILVAGAQGTSSFGGFGVGAGNTSTYNLSSLATLLNVSTSLLSSADFIAFEGNGTPGITVETSTWTFTDGANNLIVSHTFGNTPTQDGAAVLALGNVNPFNYNIFFGASNLPAQGDLAYILFDLNGINTSSSNFAVTMNSPGDGTKPGTPDLDALGTLAVPEPNSVALLAIGLLAMSSGACYARRLQNRTASQKMSTAS